MGRRRKIACGRILAHADFAGRRAFITKASIGFEELLALRRRDTWLAAHPQYPLWSRVISAKSAATNDLGRRMAVLRKEAQRETQLIFEFADTLAIRVHVFQLRLQGSHTTAQIADFNEAVVVGTAHLALIF